MIKKHFLLFALAAFLLPGLLFSQQLQQATEPGSLKSSQLQKRLRMLDRGEELRMNNAQCNYDAVQEKLYADPQIRANAEAMEKALQKKIRKIEADKARGTYKAQVHTIPVVFHVLHLGESIGTGHNLPEDQLESAIEALNRDFRRTAADGGVAQGSGVDTEIEFCLASIDPNGNPHSGINRINANNQFNYQSIGMDEDVNGANLKALSKWPTADYVNVWVVREINNQGDVNTWNGGTLGYAYPVSSSSANNPNTNPSNNSLDGIVLVNFSIGNDPNNNHPNWNIYFNLNRTLTHEMGHHLNLQHTFKGASCSESNCNTQGDFVCDTPPTSQQTNCNTPACGGTQQVSNYMDYTGENCASMFSDGQSIRMRAVLEGTSRFSLTQSAGCSPDKVEAEFTADVTTVIVGQDIQFTDQSTSGTAVNDWDWDFGDGNSSTSQNPSHNYATVGLKTVSLTASNGIDADTETKTNYINVIDGASGVCDTLINLSDAELGALTYYNYPSGGYVPGHATGIAGYAEQFIVPAGTYNLKTFQIGIFTADFASSNSSVNFDIYDDNAGLPGTVIASKTVKISDLDAGFFNIVDLNSPVALNGTFYVAMHYPTAVAGDTVVIPTIGDRASDVNTSFVQTNDGTWVSFSDGFGLDVSLAIAVEVYQNPTAGIAPGTFTVCPDETVNFSGNTSVNASSYSWTFGGGTPNSATGINSATSYDASGDYTVTLTVDNGCGVTDDVTQQVDVTSPPTLSFSATDADCGTANGSATVTASGGGTYSYDWIGQSNNTKTLSGVESGWYKILVGNGTCEILDSVQIGQNGGPEFTIDVTNATCGEMDGSATVVPTNGATYTYSWTGQGNNTSTLSTIGAGEYEVVVSAGGCSVTDTAFVTESGGEPTFSMESETSICGQATGSAIVEVSNGQNYSFEWLGAGNQNDTLFDLVEGWYYVEVSKGGCVVLDSVEVVDAPFPFQIAMDSLAPKCGFDNGKVWVTASPVGSYDYTWTGVSSTTDTAMVGEGTYSVLVSDGLCSASSDVSVTNVGDIPTLAVNANKTTIDLAAESGEVQFSSSGSDAGTFEWDFGTGDSSTDPNPTYTFTTEGTFVVTITITNADGCTSAEQITIVVDNTTGIEEWNKLNKAVSIFPNPNDGSFALAIEKGISVEVNRIAVLNPLGQVLVTKELNASNEKIQLQTLSSGVYLLQITTSEGTILKRFEIK
jgi:PKD repeat protein